MCVYIYTHIYMYIYVYIYMCICIYIYIYIQGLIWSFQIMLWIMYFGATISKISMFKNTGLRYSFVHSELFLFTHSTKTYS